ncbi:MAG TPA: hypothetical protein VJ770_29470 [Stellaceae bacterium]|nr:hypothetical protein [Stellaceae bacterium]
MTQCTGTEEQSHRWQERLPEGRRRTRINSPSAVTTLLLTEVEQAFVAALGRHPARRGDEDQIRVS